MFVGHYAACLAAKKFEKRVSLGVLFLAVQLLDILFFPFVLMGWERINIVERYTASTHFELEYMPYSHSLLAALAWSGAAYALFRWVVVKHKTVALFVGLAVFSHWILDLVVHVPDLPLWSDTSLKLGFGLWNYPVVTFTLEAVLLISALWLYLKSSSATTAIGKYGMAVYVVVLILLNIGNIFGPVGDPDKTSLAISALAAYFLFVGIAFWLDRKRV